MITTILASTAVSSALIALLGILGKFWIDRKIQQDKHIYDKKISDIRTKLEISLHADKSIFEKEFQSSVETWNSLLKFKSETECLYRDAEDTEKFEKQLEICFKQHVKTHDLLYNNAPFLPKPIRDSFFKVAELLQCLYQLPHAFTNEADYVAMYKSMYDHEVEKVKSEILELEKYLRDRYLQEKL